MTTATLTLPERNTERQATLVSAYRDYMKSLNSYASFKLNDRTMGEDMVQDTFTKAWRYMVRGGEVGTMRAFLYRILNNLIIDEYRKRKYAMTSLDELLENGFEPGDDESVRFVNVLDGEIAMLLIGRLPSIYQEIMHMRYIHGLSITEISLTTGETRNAVAVRTHRGIKKLAVLYKQGRLA